MKKVLMIGHIESFNPAVIKLKEIIEEVGRLCPFLPEGSAHMTLGSGMYELSWKYDLDIISSHYGFEVNKVYTIFYPRTGVGDYCLNKDTYHLERGILSWPNP